MKTLVNYKSLLLAGGFLLVALNSALYTLLFKKGPEKINPIQKDVVAIRSRIDSGATTLFEEIAGKLFPVLKNFK